MRPSMLIIPALILAAACVSARAADPAGVWKSNSGSQITIPANPNDFDIIFKGSDGKKMLVSAGWVAGEVGKQFTYTFNNVAAICTFDDDHKITVRGPNGVSIWTRERTMTSAAKK